jgi:hypothetical protein
MGKVQCRKMWMGWRHNGEVDGVDDVGGIGIWIWKGVDVWGGSLWGDWIEVDGSNFLRSWSAVVLCAGTARWDLGDSFLRAVICRETANF